MTMKKEDILHKMTEGKPNPFRTPEGYFDQFTSRLMEQLPEPEKKEEKPVILTFIPRVWRYAAVAIVAVGLGGAIYWGQNKPKENLASTSSGIQYEYTEEYIEDALDYAMINSNDISEYLTSAE